MASKQTQITMLQIIVCTKDNQVHWRTGDICERTHRAIVFQLELSSLMPQHLTHLPLDKMAAILADDIFKGIFLNENV